MHGQLDLWVEWVLPEEEDRLYYTTTHTESEKIASGVLKDWEEFSGFQRERHIPVKVPDLPEAKNSHCSQRPSSKLVLKYSSQGSLRSVLPWEEGVGVSPGRSLQGFDPCRWRLIDALLLTIAFLLP